MLSRRLAALAVALLAAGLAQAATFHVFPAGDDAAAGDRPEQAFRTIRRGIQALKPGDTLLVGPGVYHEEVLIDRSGASEQPITIRAAIPGRAELVGSVRLADWAPVPGRRQVFRAALDRTTYLVYEKDTDTDYTEVANLATVEREAGTFFYDPDEKAIYVHPSDDLGMGHHVVDACVLDYGIAAKGATVEQPHTPRMVGLVIEGFVVRDYNDHGIFIWNADDCAIRDCVVHHCRRGIFTYNALRSRISGCEVFACADRNNREQGDIGMMGYSFDCLIEGNIVHRTRQHGARFYGGFYGCVMRGNLAYDCQIGLHVKGALYDHATAVRLARFSDNGKPDLRPDLRMVIEGNVALWPRSVGLIPHYSRYLHNTTVNAQSGRVAESRANLELLPEDVEKAHFADPAWNDLRLQADSPHRQAGPGGVDLGARPYRDEVFYVSPDGDDDRPGTSAAQAWKTLDKAAARLRPGHTLYLLPGVYPAPLVLKGLRAADQPTTVRAFGRGRVVLDAGGARPAALEISDCDYARIEGLALRGAKNCGAAISASSRVQISESEVFDNAGDGVRVGRGCRDVRLMRNTIAFNGGRGAVVEADAAGTRVVGNILRHNTLQLDLPGGSPADLFCDLNSLGGGVVGSLRGQAARTIEGWQSLTAGDARSADLPPGFADAAGRDLRLTRTSLCRGRGWLDTPIGAGRLMPIADDKVRFADARVVAVHSESAVIAWTVTGGETTELVAYGEDPERTDRTILRDKGPFYGRNHSCTLAGLKPETRYYVRVGHRRLLDGPTPYHSFNYAWPERSPKGEEEYYQTLRKHDEFDERLLSFTTPARDAPTPRVIHVSPQGSDAASGAEAAPVRTLGRASEMAHPGDRVVVAEGVYVECLRPERNGLPGHPITFEAAPGARVEINGRRELIPFGVDLRDRHHVVVRGFAFFGQTEKDEDRGGFGQVCVVEGSNIRIERCLFDGRMNYVNPVYVAWSRDVTVHDNVFAAHHCGIIAHDNRGALTVTQNTFVGPTIHSIYAPRNERVVIRNNIFGENLFPTKKQQYKVVLMANAEVDMDHNCYYFDPQNDERRVVDIAFAGADLARITALPEEQAAADRGPRYGVKGNLDLWQKQLGRGLHDFIADPKWRNPAAIEKARHRSRGWPNRFFTFEPLRRADLGVADDSPCLRAGDQGGPIGAQCAE